MSMRAGRRATLTGQLLSGYVPVMIVIFLVSAVVLDRVVENGLVRDLNSSLETSARTILRVLPEPSGYQRWVQTLGNDLGLRITLIERDGTVVADSWHDPSTMDNHAGRPEVRTALAGRVGLAARASSTVDDSFRYLALPPDDGIVVRVALPLSQLQTRLGRARATIAVCFGLALLFGMGALLAVSRGISRPLEEMTATVSRMSSGDLSVRTSPQGGQEVAVLGEAFNHMASELGRRIEEVRRDRERLDLILAAMEEGVLLVDTEEVVEYANQSARSLLGHDPHSLTTIVPQMLRHLTERARTTRQLQQVELEMGQPLRVVRASAIPVGQEGPVDGPAGTVLLVLRDVTEARRVEAVRRDFVANASHELKTPVAAIRAAAETIQEALEDDPEGARRFANRLITDAARLSRIVGDLLDLSRLEAGRSPRDRVRLDLVAAEEAERFMFPAEEASLQLEISTDTPVTVLGSATSLALLVRNLLDNAIRYTRPSGRVQLSVAPRDGEAVIEVQDTGMGIPSRHLPRIFERFYRVDPARSRETGGTGLGLAIVKHVAEQLEGRVEAESELGRGSTFRVVLPRVSADGYPPPAGRSA